MYLLLVWPKQRSNSDSFTLVLLCWLFSFLFFPFRLFDSLGVERPVPLTEDSGAARCKNAGGTPGENRRSAALLKAACLYRSGCRPAQGTTDDLPLVPRDGPLSIFLLLSSVKLTDSGVALLIHKSDTPLPLLLAEDLPLCGSDVHTLPSTTVPHHRPSVRLSSHWRHISCHCHFFSDHSVCSPFL